MDKDRLITHYFVYSLSFYCLSLICSFVFLSMCSMWLVVAPTLTIMFSIIYFFAAIGFIDALITDSSTLKIDIWKYACKVLNIATLVCLVASIISYNYYVGFVNV